MMNVSLRLSLAEQRDLDAWAKAAKLTRSALLRQIVTTALREQLADDQK